MLRSGFAVCDITPTIGSEMPGGFSPRVSTGVFNPLEARAAVFRNDSQALMIIGVDAVSLRFETIVAARRKLVAACGIAPRRILICASHTHCGGPANSVLGTEANEAYLAQVADGIAQAGLQAWNRATDAAVVFGKNDCPGWGFNRRWVMRDGNHATNPGKKNADKIRPAGPVDSEVSFLLVTDAAGKPMGAIGNFTCHSTVFWMDQFTPDYCWYWQQALRQTYGEDFVLVFTNGACGDINQIDFSRPDGHESGEEHAITMGNALAAAAIKAVTGKAPDTEPQLFWAGTDVELPLRLVSPEQLSQDQALVASDAPWNPAKWQARDRILLTKECGDKRCTLCPVDVYQVGEALFAASSWQPFCEFGLRLKTAAPSRVVVTMLANGNVGYIPTPAAFVGGGYEPTLCRGSHHVPEAGDIIADASLALLKTVAR